MYCRMIGSIPGLYPLNALRRQPKQPSDITKWPPVEDHWCKPNHRIISFRVGEILEITKAKALPFRKSRWSLS